MQQKFKSRFAILNAAALVFTTLLVFNTNLAEASSGTYVLEGVGYREQALQQPKTSFFSSEAAEGVRFASFAGGTNIFIKGPELNENPQSNIVYFRSLEFNNIEIPAPPLNEDDAFNSNPMLGFITYRIPSPFELFGVATNAFDQYTYLHFYISVKAPDVFGEEQHMECSKTSYCLVRFMRTYSPVVHYVNPPVIYYEATTELWFNPLQTLGLIQNLKSDEKIFVNTEIGGSKLDYEFQVDYDDSFSNWNENSVIGTVGDMPVGHDKGIKMLWEVGYAVVAEQEATHCSYDMSKCYHAMNVPSISNISAHQGYTNGGQNLTIYGHGFDHDDITIEVAGQACNITQFQDSSVSCEIQPATTPSVSNVSQSGSYGLSMEFYNETSTIDWDTWAHTNYTKTLLTQLEVPTDIDSYLGYKIQGWFVPPATAGYRFHMNCDDQCEFNMGLNTSDPLTTTQIVYRGSWTYRRYFFREGSPQSEWYNLTKGEKYYIYARHREWTGGDNFGVGVEINQTAVNNDSYVANHHHAMKEVQYISIGNNESKHEIFRITVDGVNLGGTYLLRFQDPDDLGWTNSNEMAVDCSQNTLKNAINSFFSSKYGTNVEVNRTMYDVNGTEVTSTSDATQAVYYVRLKKLINGISHANIKVIKDTTATITVDQAGDIQTSDAPLEGSYRIVCPGPAGNAQAMDPYTTEDIPITQSSYWVSWNLFKNCTDSWYNIDMWHASTFDYKQNGIALYARFIGSNGEKEQMRIISGVDTPLTGYNLQTNNSKYIEASNDIIFYEAIPFEMLRTYETEPQVRVWVGDYPAVCKNLECNYLYVEPAGEVTAFTYTDGTRELVLTGIDLPVNSSMVRHVEFAHSKCTISAISNESLTCVLDYEPVCGDHLPYLSSIYGLVNNSANLTESTITCTATSVVPTTQLNLLGGDNLTISGTQFPWNIKTSTVDIKFTDTQETLCTPQWSTSTTLVCLTHAFDIDASAGQSYGLTIVINNQTVTNTLSMSTMPNTKAGILLTPPSANPTLKTKINITLESDFPYTLTRADFSVNATNISNPSYFRQMNVIGADDSTKTLTVMFGGAWSGMYQINMRHSVFGLLNTNGLNFTVGSNVTDYSPKTGSIYGGTLLTITGTNFGSEFTDNPVQISTLGGVGSIDCFLQSISETEIVCRLDSCNKTHGEEGKMLVFLKTSEEATCVPNDTCAWTYSSAIPTVRNISTHWDTTSQKWQVIVNGTGWTGSAATTMLLVNGVQQTTVTHDTTGNFTVFQVTDIANTTLSNMKVYFDVGTPAGHNTVIDGVSLELQPKLISLDIQEGSAGGSLIVARVEGLGNVSDASWTSLGVNLAQNSTGSYICDSVRSKSYGVIYCLTKKTEFAAASSISLFSYPNRNYTVCEGSDSALCVYEQLQTASLPAFTAIDNSVSNTIVFTGTNFYTSGYVANVSYGGAVADTITVDSATQVTATWTFGMPPLGEALIPDLWFNSTTTETIHVAYHDSSSRTLPVTKSLGTPAGPGSLSCSFAGGCQLEVTAEGLSSILKNDTVNNFISVCDEKCEFVEASSDSSKAVCKLPKISTVYSNEQFKIETSKDDLRFRRTFGTLTDIQKVFDHQLTMMPTVDSRETECYVGGSFKENHVGMLSQVKYFMGDIDDKTQYADLLKFQGSADNATWTDLFTVDENVHEGWNYYQWESSVDQPKYRFYRLYNNQNKGCDVSELKMSGVETVDNSDATYTCAIAIEKDNENLANLTETVTYSGTLTPLLTAVNPRYGTVTGGTSVTFTGTNLVTDTALYSIVIDGRSCTVTAATTTSVTCTTDHRPGLISPSLEIFVDEMGLVSNQELLFRYVSMWSDDTTWGGEFAPMEGESIYVPEGLNLYIDVDSTPELNLVMVEGSLIFAPDADANHERYFDANYIFLNNAYMEVGTEEFPYTSKLTITMHGNISSPYLPIFGNKCIAVKHSTLDMHGIQRVPTWSVLNETALPGATEIKMNQAVDWVAGEEIAIAATSYNGREGEKRRIASIDNTNPDIPVITLDAPLDYKHFAMTQWYGDDFIDMRAEVGLLTRNVKYRGDPENSFPNQYGATIFLHSEGDDSLVARLEYIELNEVGQAFKVGRYAVHFHMIGAVHKSYCKGFGTHTSFNRAFTLHGTHYMRLVQNVAYDVKGHVIFIEDAVEKKNHIEGNLIMKAKRSWSLLNTDQTPACFWITNPDNNFYNNSCGGSDRYGYWYDLQTHAIGPHANTNVCPENERVGEFRNNSAHSCGRYGLRIFHNMIPRKFPCKGITYDADYVANNQTDPFWQNPAITANFYDLTSWKNGRNGAIAEKVGDVRFHNFKVADNKLAGIEFSLTDNHGDNTTRINNALIIGRTNNSELALEISEPYGMIGPRTENFRVDGARFFNFDWNQAAALSSCSHCFHPAATDSGARTIRFSNLSFDSSVQRIANYQYPWKAIFLDEDGTLTGKGAGSWATPYYPHHNHTQCEINETYYGGVFCDNTIQIRRIAFWRATPTQLFRGMGFKVIRYDDDIRTEYGDNVTAYLGGNMTNYTAMKEEHGSIIFKKKLDPANGWAVPFVTDHKYKIHFGMTGLDYESLIIDASERWEEWDKSIYLVHNWTDVRQQIDFKIGINGQMNGWIQENNTIDDDPANWVFGQHVVYNETEVRETHIIINGKNQSNNPYEEQTIYQVGHRCIGNCNEDITENPLEDRIRYWNVSTDWTSGKVPEEGEDVHIESGWQMVFNLNPSPKFKLLRVNGRLTFENTTDTHLKVKHLFIRAGELHIGSEEYPMKQFARITLYGEKGAETIVYDNAIEAGNKNIANVGKLRVFGSPRQWKITRLMRPAEKGQREFYIEPGLEIFDGDRLALLPTSYEPHNSDDIFVKSYDSNSGKVSIDTELNYYHWGKSESTAAEYSGLDMRGEVILLTRNVLIDAEDIDSWGGQIVTSDTQEMNGGVMTDRFGSTILRNVEIRNCSQIDTLKAAIRFESAATYASEVTNCSIHNGYSWAVNVMGSANINMSNNVIFNFRPIGVAFQKSRNITFDNNVVSNIIDRTTFEGGDGLVDKAGGISICAYGGEEECPDMFVRNNTIAGSVYGGLVIPGHDCGDTSGRYGGNVAHSIKGIKSGHGLYFKNTPSQTCAEFSDFKAYKCYYQGAFAYPTTKQLIMRDMVMVDNKEGFGAYSQSEADDHDFDTVHITIKDSIAYGEHENPDCPQNGQGGFCHRFDKYGFMQGSGTRGGKPYHIGSTSPLPPQKIKSIATMATQIEMHNITFKGFRSTTEQGQRQRIFEFQWSAADLIPIHKWYNTKFIDNENDAFAYLWVPPQKWAIIKDCGEFPCTAPYNTYYQFVGTTFEGRVPPYIVENFTMIPNTPDFSKFVPDCEFQQAMNAWTCQQMRLGQLLFESEDVDTLDRSVQPIYAKLQGTRIDNKVNSFMDHVWDGFYTGQTRLSRFPVIMYLPQGAVYDIMYTGSPPKKQFYTLVSMEDTVEMIVRIAYPGAESRQILKDGKRVDMNQWDENERGYGPITRSFCGENRYIGVKNILEFYLTKGCKLQIAPRNAIQTMVRMEWSVDAFFSNGGTTNFIDRVSGSLGIHASTIKVVSVYEGSLVVNYDINVDDPADDSSSSSSESASTASTSDAQLADIKAKQTAAFSTGAMDLGAPITDVELTVVENVQSTDNSSSSNSSDSSSDSSSEESVPQKIISGGQVTAPGYPPVIFNMDAYWNAQLLRSKNADYDAKALRLAQTLANVTLACQAHPCTLLKTGSDTDLDPFFNKKDEWSFWSVFNFNDSTSSDAQGIYLKKSVSVDNNNPGSALSDESRVLLVYGAQNPKVWTTGDENSAILLAYDAVDASDSKLHINIRKYDNLNKMKANDSSEHKTLSLTNSAASESKPSFQDVKWHGSIGNSEITLLYEFENGSGAIKLAQGKHGTDGSWSTTETNQDSVYTTDGFSASFNPFHKIIYQDETFYLTGTDRLQNGVQPEQNVVLLDADMTPLSILPMDLPTQTQMDDIISNHTSPTMKRISETVALSFQHRNTTEAGEEEYFQFLYFVDLQEYLPKARDIAPQQPPEPEHKSILTRVVDIVVNAFNWLFRRR